MLEFIKNHITMSVFGLILLIYSIVIEFVLRDIPEIFPKAGIAADFVIGFSLSYISAIIFFVVAIYLPDKKRRSKVAPIVNKSLGRIEHYQRWFFSENKKVKLTDEYIENWCRNTKLLDSARIVGFKGEQFNYLKALEIFLVRNTIEEIDVLTKFSAVIHPEILEDLYDLRKSGIFDYIEKYPPSHFNVGSEQNMEFLKQNFIDLLKCTNKLRETHNKFYK